MFSLVLFNISLHLGDTDIEILESAALEFIRDTILKVQRIDLQINYVVCLSYSSQVVLMESFEQILIDLEVRGVGESQCRSCLADLSFDEIVLFGFVVHYNEFVERLSLNSGIYQFAAIPKSSGPFVYRSNAHVIQRESSGRYNSIILAILTSLGFAVLAGTCCLWLICSKTKRAGVVSSTDSIFKNDDEDPEPSSSCVVVGDEIPLLDIPSVVVSPTKSHHIKQQRLLTPSQEDIEQESINSSISYDMMTINDAWSINSSGNPTHSNLLPTKDLSAQLSVVSLGEIEMSICKSMPTLYGPKMFPEGHPVQSNCVDGETDKRDSIE